MTQTNPTICTAVSSITIDLPRNSVHLNRVPIWIWCMWRLISVSLFWIEMNSDSLHWFQVCSRLVDELMKKGNYKNQKTSYHCSQNGNFERLQCNDQFCYCADPYTGQSLSVLVPYQLWDTLTCCKWFNAFDIRADTTATDISWLVPMLNF